MKQLNIAEICEVSGGGAVKEIAKGIGLDVLGNAAWDALKAGASAAWDGLTNMNQGGTPSGTDALGNNW